MASLRFGSLELLADPYVTLLGSDFGAPEPITSSTSSLFLDGAVVSGDATGNREIRLLVAVTAASRTALASACEALAGEVNAGSNTLTWAPDMGADAAWDSTVGAYDDVPVSMVFETFRGSLLPSEFDPGVETRDYTRRYELRLPALPFARSTTRRTPQALAPLVYVVDFEDASYTGVLWTVPPSASTSPYYQGGVASSTSEANALTDLGAANPSASSGGLSYWSAVANCALAVDSSTAAALIATASAAGDVEARVQAYPVAAGGWYSAQVLTCAEATLRDVRVGIEWVGASGTISTDWGVPTPGLYLTADAVTNAKKTTVSCYAPAPAGATSARVHVKWLDCAAGEQHRVKLARLTASPGVTEGSVATSATATYVKHGSRGLAASLERRYDGSHRRAALFTGRVPVASVDMSGLPRMSCWVYLAAGSTFAEALSLWVRLFDAAGRWTRWRLDRADNTASWASGTWEQLACEVATPFESSPAGAADLAAITDAEFEMLVTQGYSSTNTADTVTVSLDALAVGPNPSPTTSTRGTVLTLDDVHGSARSPATVELSASAAMTDFLVLAVTGDGEPLLVASSNVATAAAPAGYEGVYSIIGCLSPAVSLSSPQVTVAQLIGGTSVATKTLTGTARTGSHYVDFGTVELPLVPVPDENQGVSYTFTLSPSSTSWTEVLVVDVDASLAWVDNLTTARQYAWIDEPDPATGIGEVWVGAAADRSDARGLTNAPTLSKPLQVKAPATTLLVYSTAGAPSVALSYYPRWLSEPTA